MVWYHNASWHLIVAQLSLVVSEVRLAGMQRGRAHMPTKLCSYGSLKALASCNTVQSLRNQILTSRRGWKSAISQAITACAENRIVRAASTDSYKHATEEDWGALNASAACEYTPRV